MILPPSGKTTQHPKKELRRFRSGRIGDHFTLIVTVTVLFFFVFPLLLFAVTFTRIFQVPFGVPFAILISPFAVTFRYGEDAFAIRLVLCAE